MNRNPRRPRRARRLIVRTVLALLMATLISNQRVRTAGVIHVTTTSQGIANDGFCSLQEAIYSANLDNGVAPSAFFPTILFSTGCEAGSGDDVIELTAGATYQMSSILNDPYNALGPTATPIILSNITIEASGALIVRPNPGRDFTGLPNFRAFAVANADAFDPDHEISLAGGGGSLTLRNAHVKGFTAHGGNGADGGGGGMGAGGAIYVAFGALTIENSTFQDNGVHGGNGSHNSPGWAGGGGGGFSGNGGQAIDGGGGGGGGARGDGGDGEGGCGTPCLGLGVGGGGGGGTLHGGDDGDSHVRVAGGGRCGGDGGYITLNPFDSPRDGGFGRCPGGGGGGGRDSFFGFAEVSGGNGGAGNYGGGGGGGAYRMTYGDGGHGGFGGGGGAADAFSSNFSGFGPDGGDGGFGGGGGAGHGGWQPIGGGAPGDGGSFAGHAIADEGGGGAGLGGAIFSHRSTVVVRNSTLYGNFALQGSPRGSARGGAIFAIDSSLTVLNSTLAYNEVLGRGAGIVVYRSTESGSASLTLRNTIISNSFPADRECFYLGGTVTIAGSRNLITHNTNAPASGSNPDLPESRCPGNIVDAPDDPLLGSLTLNEPGLTPTVAISSGPALDAGDAGTCEAFDQRGVIRPQQAACDIGAFEARYPDFAVSPIGGFSVELGETVTFPFTVSSIDGFSDPVSLTVDTGTSGLEASLDPSSVTPLPNQPASVLLTVHAGSGVVAGNHRLVVTATSGNRSRQLFFGVPVGVTFGGMAKTIDEFAQLGEIANIGVATALGQKLTAAQRLVDSGDLQAGVNVLSAFGWQVRALSGTQIGSAAAVRLLANLDALVAGVAPQLVPNPVIGTVVNAAGLPVAGATVAILDAAQSIVADAQTDVTGFYYIARTSKWASAASYSAKVTLSKPYKRSAPSSQTFAWQKSPIVLSAFVLSN